MHTEIKNGVYTISDDNSSVKLTQEEALKLAKTIFDTAKDDYRTLKPGDHIWYVDYEEKFLEEGIVTSVERNSVDFSVNSFGVEFLNPKDFDEFYGTSLGDSIFLSKELAEYKMNYWTDESRN